MPSQRPCAVDECVNLTSASSGSRYCSMHYGRLRRTGSLGPAGRLTGTGDSLTYVGVHAKIRRVRGDAREHLCPCGAQAQHWAMLPTVPPESIKGSLPGRLYVTDINQYAPRCVSCHTLMDGSNSGEKHGRALFTEEDVRAVRARYASGERIAHLAREFNVTTNAIGSMVHRKTWRHVA